MSRFIDFTLPSTVPGRTLHGFRCVPEGQVRAVLQLSHGMVEYIDRYRPLAEYLADRGILVTGHDHLGHGASIRTKEDYGYFAEPDGNRAVLADLHAVTVLTKELYPNLPYFLLGHSMGSLIARCYLRQYPDILDGLILSGSPSPLPAMTRMQSILNRVIVHRGDTSHSKRIDRILYNTFQRPFRSESRSNTWICSDEAVVDAYNADPLCQFHFTLNGYATLLALLNTTYNTKDWTITQPELPIWFFSGGDDPCRGNDTRFQQAVDRMAELGYQNVNSTLFPRMRHEILNERNKAVVYAEILETLDAWNC